MALFVSALNAGTAAMNNASGGSSNPNPTAAASPPKKPTDLGTSTSTVPTWTFSGEVEPEAPFEALTVGKCGVQWSAVEG